MTTPEQDLKTFGSTVAVIFGPDLQEVQSGLGEGARFEAVFTMTKPTKNGRMMKLITSVSPDGVGGANVEARLEFSEMPEPDGEADRCDCEWCRTYSGAA